MRYIVTAKDSKFLFSNNVNSSISEWSQDINIQELQKRSLELRKDRYKFGRNKIIRERERNLSRIAGTLFIPQHQSGHHYSFLITTNLRIQDLVLEFNIIN